MLNWAVFQWNIFEFDKFLAINMSLNCTMVCPEKVVYKMYRGGPFGGHERGVPALTVRLLNTVTAQEGKTTPNRFLLAIQCSVRR